MRAASSEAGQEAAGDVGRGRGVGRREGAAAATARSADERRSCGGRRLAPQADLLLCGANPLARVERGRDDLAGCLLVDDRLLAARLEGRDVLAGALHPRRLRLHLRRDPLGKRRHRCRHWCVPHLPRAHDALGLASGRPHAGRPAQERRTHRPRRGCCPGGSRGCSRTASCHPDPTGTAGRWAGRPPSQRPRALHGEDRLRCWCGAWVQRCGGPTAYLDAHVQVRAVRHRLVLGVLFLGQHGPRGDAAKSDARRDRDEQRDVAPQPA